MTEKDIRGIEQKMESKLIYTARNFKEDVMSQNETKRDNEENKILIRMVAFDYLTPLEKSILEKDIEIRGSWNYPTEHIYVIERNPFDSLLFGEEKSVIQVEGEDYLTIERESINGGVVQDREKTRNYVKRIKKMQKEEDLKINKFLAQELGVSLRFVKLVFQLIELKFEYEERHHPESTQFLKNEVGMSELTTTIL
jgi:hypothetical protein